jgi:polysaccharide biosynthesis transport protein
MAPSVGSEQRMSNDVQTVNDYLNIFRRRRLLLGGTIFILTLAFITVAYVWPPTYLSSGTILIEQQDVPEELVRSTVTNFAEERIQIVTQRVMTSARLTEIIEKFGLYESEAANGEAIAVLVDRFRADTSLDTLRADISGSGGRGAVTSTIAFTVGYHNESPQTAKKVAEELVNLYLSENARSRAEAAQETSEFLSRRAAGLDEELRLLGDRMAGFKEQHSDSLPTLQALNIDRLEGVKREIESVGRDNRTLRDSINLLEAELALMSPFAAYEGAQGTMAAPQRLDELQRDYIALSSRYAPSHPDVARVRREIELLTGGNLVRDLTAIEERLYSLRQRLQVAEQEYSANHPEVAGIQRQIRELEQQRGDVLDRSVRNARPTNPLYVQKEGQLKGAQNQLAASQARLEALTRERAAYENRLARSPEVERDLSALEREYEAKLAQFREIQGKLESALLAETLEIEERGERFALIDPPKVPQDPVSPNRTGIMLLGLVVALGAGLGLATLVDSMDTTVRGAQDIVELFRTPPIASIMYLETAEDVRRRHMRTAMLAGAAVASVAVVAVIIV